MAQRIPIKLSQLIIDPRSARAFPSLDGKMAPAGILPRHRQRQILELARHISIHGPNPADLFIIMPSEDSPGEYMALEGNRRLIALKGLENPDFLAGTLDPDLLSQLRACSKAYAKNPVVSLLCVCVEHREEAAPWIEVRHSEYNVGAGVTPRAGYGSTGNHGRSSFAGDQLAAPDWSPDQIALVIMTVKRPNDYLAKTMESLVSADPQWRLFSEVGIAVDGPDANWIPVFLPARKLTVVPLTFEETARVECYKLHRRACHNYYRALQLTAPSRGLIVCEDDVVFREGWIEKLCQSLNEMQERGVSDFVLSLYSAYNHDAGAFRRGTYYSSYLASSFYGTQCVFYCSSEVSEVSSLVWKKGVEDHENPYDLILKQYCERKQNLYSTRFSLAQHIGRNSTGLGGNHHRSPTFHLPWPAGPASTKGAAGVVATSAATGICQQST